MTGPEMLAEVVLGSKSLMTRFLAGFDDRNRTSQAPSLPNHVVWCLGHCALTMHRVAERIDGASIPETDFVTGDGGAGDDQRFDTESVCFGSEPVDDARRYPAFARAVQIFEAAGDHLAGAVRGADEATLNRDIPWGAAAIPLWRLAIRVTFHNGVHGGQITDLRRALGLEKVI